MIIIENYIVNKSLYNAELISREYQSRALWYMHAELLFNLPSSFNISLPTQCLLYHCSSVFVIYVFLCLMSCSFSKWHSFRVTIISYFVLLLMTQNYAANVPLTTWQGQELTLFPNARLIIRCIKIRHVDAFFHVFFLTGECKVVNCLEALLLWLP